MMKISLRMHIQDGPRLRTGFHWLIITSLLTLLMACDPYNKGKCQWYLEPDVDRVSTVEPGWVALCARNRVINKQRCYLRANLDYAKALQGKAFRLNTLKVKEGPYPREIESIRMCNPDAE